ncbi:hypothetical protein B0J13DRAFT_532193 [Dactylonectria estremocensis]|uniref:Uncharacterized protein n=1 Tax=Dactylonectria estremocensis TaxID=1079267 RepID=A0A9P9DJV0_9HYPO|nr:hypothetical protein B0J13DRAFT_532193 [Dactylonectria estremocensis]
MSDQQFDSYPVMDEKDLAELPSPIIHQPWTTTGYPIVDGKYIDLTTGDTKTITDAEWRTAGPPALELYWYNRTSRTSPEECDDLFTSFSASAFVDVTEYLKRLGEFLAGEPVKIASLNATTYAVHVGIMTELSQEEMADLLNRYRLWPALKDRDTV